MKVTKKEYYHDGNKYIKIPKANRLFVWSTYLDVPKQWLGKPLLDEAEFLKEANPVA